MGVQKVNPEEKLLHCLREIVRDEIRLEMARQKRVVDSPARLRLRDDLSAEQLAVICRSKNSTISKNTIQRYERGAVKNPNDERVIENVKTITSVLSCSFEEYHQAVCIACQRG